MLRHVTGVGTTNERDRESWIRRQLEALPAGWRLLDAGAGEAPYRKYCGHLEYVSQDFARYVPSMDPTGLQMKEWSYPKHDIVSDIAAIPEPDASFDAVLCAEVLEHLPEPLSAVRELSRLLKPDGVLILTAPFASLTHFAPYHFASGFSRFWYEAHLPALGVRIEEIAPNGSYFDFLAQELRRLPEIAQRYASRAPGLRERIGMRLLLDALEGCAGSDAGSAELLCFGFHVRGRKS
ncbi:MAG TPA: class I SAM-dependent methyltransferase [Myxococcota bacterium]|nr:class I SAM-dependent methyltransferase [Myxococcota bacterium]